MAIGIDPRPHFPRMPDGALTGIALVATGVCFLASIANMGFIDWDEYQPTVRALIVGSAATAVLAGGRRIFR